jgi:hypothetical protein
MTNLERAGGIKLTGLWKNKRNGLSWLSGSLGGGRVLVYKNRNKTGNAPDFNVYLFPNERTTSGVDDPYGI